MNVWLNWTPGGADALHEELARGLSRQRVRLCWRQPCKPSAHRVGSKSRTVGAGNVDGVDKAAAGYAPRYDPPPPPCHADGIYGPATDAQRPACSQCAFHLRTIDGLQRELRRCRAELTKLHYLVAPNDLPPPLERHSSPVMMSRPCRKFRRLDSPIARVDENNGYGDDAALELALQASLEDAARATPRRKAAPPPGPPGPQLHPFG